ncbi:hypothetical protein HJG44_08660 [Enterovirga sp. DB1703]|uniref:Uncharacterized protein n=1 Tax=Enterovirga aerilata TaxID=2730920 RepID=A0A849I8R4_9HYPH|nr:hypothetical protein [Enterovirga sp. DB1703]
MDYFDPTVQDWPVPPCVGQIASRINEPEIAGLIVTVIIHSINLKPSVALSRQLFQNVLNE